MKPTAILYTSNSGHTRQYALLLGERVGLPVFSLDEAMNCLPRGRSVVYLGWIHASRIKGYASASRRFSIAAVGGVGLCDTGTLLAEVRQATGIPESIPLFTLQGGLVWSRLKGMDKLMLTMLKKGLAASKQRCAQEERMLELLSRDASYVHAGHLTEMVQWCEGQR